LHPRSSYSPRRFPVARQSRFPILHRASF